MLTLYFSGTGNTKYIAQLFSKKMKCPSHSIEENIDFGKLIKNTETIAICYPIYGSDVPMIMQKFIEKYKALFEGKKLIIFCTQLLFSGDGARVLTEFLEGVSVEIIYTEHFNMPNNICNQFPLRIQSAKKVEKYVEKANVKMEKVCENIRNGIVRKRGFNTFSKNLGALGQRVTWRKMFEKATKDVRITKACNVCGKCIRICPMKNLTVKDKQIVQLGQCTACYRCVNACPKRAITVYVHGEVKRQYLGVGKCV